MRMPPACASSRCSGSIAAPGSRTAPTSRPTSRRCSSRGGAEWRRRRRAPPSLLSRSASDRASGVPHLTRVRDVALAQRTGGRVAAARADVGQHGGEATAPSPPRHTGQDATASSTRRATPGSRPSRHARSHWQVALCCRMAAISRRENAPPACFPAHAVERSAGGQRELARELGRRARGPVAAGTPSWRTTSAVAGGEAPPSARASGVGASAAAPCRRADRRSGRATAASAAATSARRTRGSSPIRPSWLTIEPDPLAVRPRRTKQSAGRAENRSW